MRAEDLTNLPDGAGLPGEVGPVGSGPAASTLAVHGIHSKPWTVDPPEAT